MNQDGGFKNNLEVLAKNTAIFAIGTFASKVLVLLVIPLCTFFIDTESMGMFDLLYSIILLLQPIAILAIPESLFRWLLDTKVNKRTVISTWVVMFIGLFMFFSILYWIVYLVIQFDNAILLYCLVLASCAYQGLQFGTRGLHSNKLFAFQGVLYAALYAGLGFIFVGCLSFGYRGLLYALLIAMLSCICLMLSLQPELRRFSFKNFSRFYACEMMRYSICLLPNTLSWWGLNWLSRMFVVGFLGLSANGLFSVAAKFPSALNMLVSIFIPAWQEQAVGVFERSAREQYFSLIFRHYSKLVISSLLVILPLTGLFVSFFIDPSYSSVTTYVPFLYFGAVLSAFSSFYGVIYLCVKHTGGAAGTTVLGAVVTAVGCAVFIPLFDLQGACVANMIGNLVMWLTRIIQTRKYCAITLNVPELVFLMGLSVVMSIGIVMLSSVWIQLVLLLFGIVIMLVINKDSFSFLSSLIKSKFKAFR